jgi:integrase
MIELNATVHYQVKHPDAFLFRQMDGDATILQFGPDYHADLDLIFWNPDGTPLKPDSVSASVSLLCRRLGLPKGASLHTLRHSHASILLANGIDLATVSTRLGHSSVRVTADVYSHALRGRDREAAGKWDELMGRTSAADRPKAVN